MTEKDTTAITCTCKICGEAFVKEVPSNFWTETPSKRWRCHKCKGKKGLEDKSKKKRTYTPEQIEAFKERMKRYKESQK